MFEATATGFQTTCCTCFSTDVIEDEPDGCMHCGSVMILVNKIVADRPAISGGVASVE